MAACSSDPCVLTHNLNVVPLQDLRIDDAHVVSGPCVIAELSGSNNWRGSYSGDQNTKCVLSVTVHDAGTCVATVRPRSVCGGASDMSLEVSLPPSGTLTCYDFWNH